MSALEAITTVYSYYLPEVRDVITRLTRDYPHEVFLRSIVPGLDDFHEPVFEKLVSVRRSDVPALGGFGFRYPTAGSEEAIREYQTLLQTGGAKGIITWKGDYEGYREVARSRGLGVLEVDFDADPSAIPPGHWFLSNPSARDGMIVPREKILAVCEAGHKVFYDLSYLGATLPEAFDVSHPNVAVAAVSFSKTYGLFYYRVGFTFSREAIPPLFANKWFKNVFGLLVAERILDELDQEAIARKYKAIQEDIVTRVNADHGLGLSPCDVFLLAGLPAASAAALTEGQREALAKYRRADFYRLCLTPYFEAHEKG